MRGKGIENPFRPFKVPRPLDGEELAILTQKLRDGTATKNQIDQIYYGHMRLAIALSCRLGYSMRHMIHDIVSESMLGLAEAINRAPEAMVDNNITPYISVVIKGKIKDYIGKQHLMHLKTYLRRIKENENFISINIDLLSQAHERIGVQQSQLNEIMELIEKAVKSDFNLKRREYKKAIIRLKAAGYSTEEVADILGVTTNFTTKLMRDVYEEYSKLENAT